MFAQAALVASQHSEKVGPNRHAKSGTVPPQKKKKKGVVGWGRGCRNKKSSTYLQGRKEDRETKATLGA